ncbi:MULTISPECIES: tryptophan synthase subunit alpha [unclassified Oceanobacter]|jgi:tryptophan synthase alpha chain|uniref:tryptophan synthase subunit alpha n=1 Tax=unclassified Oceanobacter TaxID=2620260 RepID=UPI0026E1D7CE|nr:MULTISPECIES: tryptophan synthase subunit alpha [unclassified Oceanobacter]MDO6683462.1 tryptophan synthase subunit alpha [Oceanobacter sp. 5_MG-2023]MDP2507066.1 tryptophan synthase subunit alpha [Oceanobacter sp. 3_MG-2023]MDP2548824.1 tryptophan synthase subunit alpha [Oceanobacter sp. 4_MG-2023]MDP2609587.1 tryptophan synthase subunit alpha [Oceanobacter sp. 1_MG-2023]MDP2612670.1 tryptophan synthase subunit alpha [Oceanobacter sp. 2_MG-2023]
MSRIASLFAALKTTGKKALIPYITAGDPQKDATVPMMHTLVDAGCDLIELGVPFSDPMADGPTIQLACERALEHNTSLRDVLAMVAEFRTTDSTTPVVLMGYLNPVEAMGYDTFVTAAVTAGVDGVLLVDLPPEEAVDVDAIFKSAGLDMVYLIAPTTTDERIEAIGQAGSGYVYYVSLKGVTGSKALDVDDVERNLQRIRQHVSIPVGVGFGIQNGTTAAAVSAVCDGVIVGSAIVNRIADNATNPAEAQRLVAALMQEMRSAMDQ